VALRAFKAVIHERLDPESAVAEAQGS
jgi:hypothetical protein